MIAQGPYLVRVEPSELDDGGYRGRAEKALREHVAKEDQDKKVIDRFLGLLHYARGDATAEGGLQALKSMLDMYLLVSPCAGRARGSIRRIR